MIYRVQHVTTYSYAEPVLVAHHIAHLRPRDLPGQICHRSVLRIHPQPTGIDEHESDYFGNTIAFFTLHDPHRSLTVEATSRVEIIERDLPAPESTPPWESVRAQLAADLDEPVLEAREFCFDSPLVARSDMLAQFAEPAFAPGRPILEATSALMHRIFEEFTYDPEATSVSTPLDQVLAERRGVCQDFAHLGIACLRSFGLAARYVSGYLLTRPPPGKPKLRGSDASHAWFEAYVPGTGWIAFDPTNDQIPGIEHIVTAWGRDYGDVSPLKGVVLGGGDQALKVAVDVDPLEGGGTQRLRPL